MYVCAADAPLTMAVSAESTGIYKPEDLLPAAIAVLRKKIALLKTSVDHISTNPLDSRG